MCVDSAEDEVAIAIGMLFLCKCLINLSAPAIVKMINNLQPNKEQIMHLPTVVDVEVLP